VPVSHYPVHPNAGQAEKDRRTVLHARGSVPLPGFVVDALAQYLAKWPVGDDGLVFQADKGGPILRTTLNGRWVRTLRRAGLPEDTHTHHLRHHYASVLIDGGESVKVVQERLGHSSAEETLRTYAHLMPQSDQRTRSVVELAWSENQESSLQDRADSVRTAGR
jgi:integrase